MIFCMSDFYRVRIRILLDLGMVQTHLLPNSFKQQVLWVHTLHLFLYLACFLHYCFTSGHSFYLSDCAQCWLRGSKVNEQFGHT